MGSTGRTVCQGLGVRPEVVNGARQGRGKTSARAGRVQVYSLQRREDGWGESDELQVADVGRGKAEGSPGTGCAGGSEVRWPGVSVWLALAQERWGARNRVATLVVLCTV